MWKYLPGGEPRGKLRASQSSLSGEKVHPASPDLHQSEVWCQVIALKSSALFLLLYHLFIRQNSGHWTLPVYKWEDPALQPCSFLLWLNQGRGYSWDLPSWGHDGCRGGSPTGYYMGSLGRRNLVFYVTCPKWLPNYFRNSLSYDLVFYFFVYVHE